MPYINVKTAAAMNDEMKELIREDLGKAITLMSGKTEDALMVNIETSPDLWLGGSKLSNGAYLSVMYFGLAKTKDLDRLNAELLRILNDRLGIAGDDVYITYQSVGNWGLKGFCAHA